MRHVAEGHNEAAGPPLSEAVLLILLSLANQARHGYSILKDVEELSGGRVVLSTGTLYGALQRLLASGWIERVEQEDSSRGRQAYALTAAGRGALDGEIARMRMLARVASLRLAGGGGIGDAERTVFARAWFAAAVLSALDDGGDEGGVCGGARGCVAARAWRLLAVCCARAGRVDRFERVAGHARRRAQAIALGSGGSAHRCLPRVCGVPGDTAALPFGGKAARCARRVAGAVCCLPRRPRPRTPPPQSARYRSQPPLADEHHAHL
ncbi:MAG: PadR family transcriptional regulator [Bryobacterales bacterium]|nr:PadR family transcriptional regulator [Bryobacterales bacterium]